MNAANRGDVLAYHDALIETHKALSADAYHAQQLAKAQAARAAVAELIEAVGDLLTEWDRQDSGRFDGMTAKDFFAAEARLRAALACVGGVL